MFSVLCLAFVFLRLYYGNELDGRYYCLDSYLEHSADAILTGTLDHIEPKTNTSYCYLKNVSIQLREKTGQFHFSDFLLIIKNNPNDLSAVKNTSAILPVSGSLVRASGEICSFTSPSNPGQFDEKAYYKEKNIFYQMAASNLSVMGYETNVIKQSLYQLRDRLKQVYATCMAEKEAGIVSAMLLGDKTLLDADMKSLYQTNGIGHILAISGLHITIFCTLCYKLLSLLRLPRPVPFLAACFLLAAYGIMTGFGISTSRAVIMMLLVLFAAEAGRSYEPLTAAAVSAVCILLQKPYALFSCSFLLSYSAVLGVFLTYPALRACLPERFFRQAGKRRGRRWGNIEKYLLLLREKLISSLFASVSIQITTLPVLLYFFYEIPTYGIILNLFVLPLVSVIVACSMLGGILGLFLLPLAGFPLFLVTQILHFYEFLCHFFLKLPEPVQILGRPALWQIVIYYLLLAAVCWLGSIRRYGFGKEKVRFNSLYPAFMVLCLAFSAVVLLFRKPVSGLQFTMLDVGQGDGLFLQTGDGRTILIDGGSSDVSKVGTYRIIPYLKYYGIRRIDYMIMSHSDEDHISGQRELLENRKSGIKTGCYLMAELPEGSRNGNYCNMKQTALKAGVPVYFFNTGDSIRIGALSLFCLHPDRDFRNDSPNACSVTLGLSYGSFRMLLTGDLEKEGEDAVLERLRERDIAEYTILKTAHHGSKNSTGDDFLSAVRPVAALISCGRKNRYGHPHKELLNRLGHIRSRVYRTDENGAVRICSDGKGFSVSCYRKR